MKVMKGLSLDRLDLTQEQIDFHHENGYLIIKDMFTQEECDEIHRIALEHADEKYSAILNLDREVEELRSVMKAPKIVSVMETLNEGEMVGLMSQMLFKKAGSPYAGQAWEPHQDNAYPRNPNGKYVTINIALSPQTVENGCLYIYPGSHKHGLMECIERPSYREKVGTNPGNTVVADNIELGEPVDLVMEKGDALILHGNVVHGSYSNDTKDESRPLMQYIYINKGEEYIPGRNANRMDIPLTWD